jgi:hypothetical protein
MPIFRIEDPEYFAAMTPERLQPTREITKAYGMDHGAYVMSNDPDDEASPAVMLLQLPPGGRLDRHEHDCFRVEIVLRGSLETADGQVLGPGDMQTSAPGEFYGPFVAGPEGSLTVEVFSQAKGLTNIRYDENDPESAERGKDILARLSQASASAPGSQG